MRYQSLKLKRAIVFGVVGMTFSFLLASSPYAGMRGEKLYFGNKAEKEKSSEIKTEESASADIKRTEQAKEKTPSKEVYHFVGHSEP